MDSVSFFLFYYLFIDWFRKVVHRISTDTNLCHTQRSPTTSSDKILSLMDIMNIEN